MSEDVKAPDIIPAFWMVIDLDGPGSGSTSMRHYDFDEARAEAFRLAKRFGRTFIVLAATHAARPPEPEWRDHVKPIIPPETAKVKGNGLCGGATLGAQFDLKDYERMMREKRKTEAPRGGFYTPFSRADAIPF